MRFRDLSICVVGILVAAGLLVLAGTQLDSINSSRAEMNLVSNEPLENAPPSLAFATVAMGAFRGLVVDILWLRADTLKQQGQFFDAKQLADWITILQPRFASVWQFHSWNMAYNISVTIPATEPEQRWRWVKNGYELLRDKAIVLNPKSILLYRELAVIFQEKIGGVTDEAHKHYKLQLAIAMEPLVSPGDSEYFEALAKAPQQWGQIVSDANVASFVKALKSADKAFDDEKTFVSSYLSLRQNPDRFSDKAFKVIDAFRGTRALAKFDIFAKAYQLRNVWKLDPELMQQINKLYGPTDWSDSDRKLPLDWRHPDAHAIYWAIKGLQMAGKENFSINEANTDRIIGHSLQNLFRDGTIFIWDVPSSEIDAAAQRCPLGKQIYLRQDLRMFETYNRSVMAIIEKYKKFGGGAYLSMQGGHRNMLKNAVLSFYQAGHEQMAQKIYNQLKQLYSVDEFGDPIEEFKVPLVVFVRKRLRDELGKLGLNDAKEMVQMMLRESYFRYAMRNDDEAFSREKMAKSIYDFYQSSYRDENRINLPDFKLLRYFALLDFINDGQYPANLRRALIGRIKVERPELAEQLEGLEQKMLKQAEQSKKQ